MSKEFENKVLKSLERIDEKLDEHTKILDEHTKKLNEHSEQINSLHESIVLIENKLVSEFPALFEAFELHQEMHKDYDDKNSYLSSKVEENSMRISVLEDQMKFVNN